MNDEVSENIGGNGLKKMTVNQIPELSWGFKYVLEVKGVMTCNGITAMLFKSSFNNCCCVTLDQAELTSLSLSFSICK